MNRAGGGALGLTKTESGSFEVCFDFVTFFVGCVFFGGFCFLTGWGRLTAFFGMGFWIVEAIEMSSTWGSLSRACISATGVTGLSLCGVCLVSRAFASLLISFAQFSVKPSG